MRGRWGWLASQAVITSAEKEGASTLLTASGERLFLGEHDI
jgi:hypothetical protein